MGEIQALMQGFAVALSPINVALMFLGVLLGDIIGVRPGLGGANGVGCWMGITPGGATPASFIGYGIAKRFSPNKDNFGKGEIEGVLGPVTAAHAAGPSALLPILTLGIPGSLTAAVMLPSCGFRFRSLRR